MESPLPQYVTIGLTIVGAAAAVWTRFIVVEERQANQLQRLAELSQEISQLRALVRSEERATRERFFASDLRISTLESQAETFVVRARRQR